MPDDLNLKATPRQKPVGILDVAREAGVSPATVSRVMNNNPTVAPDIRKHVAKVVADMDYRPHYAASNLPRRQTGNIAIVTPRSSRVIFSNPFFARIFEGIGECLDDSTYNLMISTTPAQMGRLLNAHTVDGIILVAAREDDEHLENLEKLKIPVVVIGAYRPDSRFNTICADYEGGIATAVHHLADQGHTRIGLINGPATSYKSKADRRGFDLAMTDRGLIETGSLDVDEYVESESYRALSAYHDQGGRFPTAYVATSDHLAVGLIRYSTEQGLNVPRDLSVVGFGDIALAEHLRPPLTTVHGDLVQLGAEATRVLLELVQGKQSSPHRIVYPMHLIERGTTSPPQTAS